MRRALPVWLFFALALIVASAAGAEKYPARSDPYVDDLANVLSPDDEAAIRAELISLHDKTGIEAVVVTMALMARFGHQGPIEPYATALFNTWAIGDAKQNDGVLMLVATVDRQMRIEVGSGYGRALDAPMEDIINSKMLPQFRDGQYDRGIRAGVAELVRVLEVRTGVLAPPGVIEQVSSTLMHLSGTVYAIAGGLFAALLALGLWGLQTWCRNRPRFCPVDGRRMERMSEDADDAKLQPGQILEERLGSMDYDVWACPQCNHVTVEPYFRWLSKYGACKSCNFHTLEGKTTTLIAATRSSTGQRRIDYHCHNCNAQHSVTQTIPRLSSSSGSSSGGGRSSGGGASGRW